MRSQTIAVCGCGPSGLAAALFLHRLGHNVRLFERFVEPKPVGSGLLLQPGGLMVLAQLGVGGSVLTQGAPIRRLLGRLSSGGRAILDLSLIHI